MNTTSTTQTQHDAIPDRDNISLMISTAWLVLQTGLFPVNRNEQSESLAKSFIRGFIGNSSNAYPLFAEFCQRILMARHFLCMNPHYCFRDSMMGWLDPENKKGFAGTRPWFENLLDKRTKDAAHLLELKAFPEAILELAEERSADNFHYWNNWFHERQAWDQVLMLQLGAVQLAFDPAFPIRR